MIYKLPKANEPLTAHDFKPGFAFMLKVGDWWQRITIHKNCPEELIAYTIRQFRKNPEEFKRLAYTTLVMESYSKEPWIDGVTI